MPPREAAVRFAGTSMTQAAVPASSPAEASAAAAAPAAATSTGKLRFAERWTIDVDELDSTSTFFCGDRLVIATPRRAIAVSREDGGVLWVREGLGGTSHMAGRVLVRLSADGDVELCDVGDGEPFATTRVMPRGQSVPRALFVGGGAVPPPDRVSR